MANSGTHLAFHKVSNPRLGHDRNGDRGHDLLDHGRVGHTSHASLDSDVGWDSFEGHDGGGTGFLRNAGLKRLRSQHTPNAL
jgi:hypothetical protein